MTHPTFTRRALLALIAISAAGCGTVHFTKPIAADATVDPASAYVYGSFKLKVTNDALINLTTSESSGSIGLHFACVDGSSFTVGFSAGNELQAIKVKPGTCSLRATYFTDAYGLKREKAYSGALMKDMVLVPGQLHYLGDYAGSIARTSGYNSSRIGWQIDDVRDQFASTTSQVWGKWPSLKNLKTNNSLSVKTVTAAKPNGL